jgi:DUF4097 and DUF4098 domain-containing protein YvlB
MMRHIDRTMIKRIALAMLAAVFVSSAPGGGGASPQTREELREEFHQTYPLAAGGRVSLENVNGSLRITAWDRDQVQVDAVKHAYTRERLAEVEIKIDAGADAVRIRTQYMGGDQTFRSDEDGRRNNPASVEYTLTVPRSARLDSIELINGSLDIEGVAGDVKASCINGRVRAHGIMGEARLSTINGGLEAKLDRLDETRPVSLNSVNGPLILTIPSDANVELKANTVHGSISNDFGLPVRTGKYVGHDLAGRLGRGGARIKLSNVNGSITIHHAPDSRPLSAPTNLLPAERKDSDDDESAVSREDAGRIAREAREAAREGARAAIDSQRIAQEAQREATQEVQRALRESQRAQDEALREVQRNQREIEMAARNEARNEARTETREARGNYPRFTEREAKTFAVSGVPRVNLGTFDGAIAIRGWDKSEVTFTAQKRAHDDKEMRGIKLRAEQRGDEIFIIAEFDKSLATRVSGHSWTTASVHLDVYVPRNANLRATTGDGHVSLNGVSGDLDLRTSDGSIEVNQGHGRVQVNTGDGHVRVVNFDGDADVRTGDGDITLEGRFSQLSARTGDGSITLALPSDSNASIETSAESVTNDGLAVAEDSNSEKRLRRWKVGQGGKLFNLRTGDGRIVLRRSYASRVN